MVMETTIKVSSDFRNKIAKLKQHNQTYQAFFEQVLKNMPKFPFDDDYRFDYSHEADQ